MKTNRDFCFWVMAHIWANPKTRRHNNLPVLDKKSFVLELDRRVQIFEYSQDKRKEYTNDYDEIALKVDDKINQIYCTYIDKLVASFKLELNKLIHSLGNNTSEKDEISQITQAIEEQTNRILPIEQAKRKNLEKYVLYEIKNEALSLPDNTIDAIIKIREQYQKLSEFKMIRLSRGKQKTFNEAQRNVKNQLSILSTQESINRYAKDKRFDSLKGEYTPDWKNVINLDFSANGSVSIAGNIDGSAYFTRIEKGTTGHSAEYMLNKTPEELLAIHDMDLNMKICPTGVDRIDAKVKSKNVDTRVIHHKSVAEAIETVASDNPFPFIDSIIENMVKNKIKTIMHTVGLEGRDRYNTLLDLQSRMSNTLPTEAYSDLLMVSHDTLVDIITHDADNEDNYNELIKKAYVETALMNYNSLLHSSQGKINQERLTYKIFSSCERHLHTVLVPADGYLDYIDIKKNRLLNFIGNDNNYCFNNGSLYYLICCLKRLMSNKNNHEIASFIASKAINNISEDCTRIIPKAIFVAKLYIIILKCQEGNIQKSHETLKQGINYLSKTIHNKSKLTAEEKAIINNALSYLYLNQIEVNLDILTQTTDETEINDVRTELPNDETFYNLAKEAYDRVYNHTVSNYDGVTNDFYPKIQVHKCFDLIPRWITTRPCQNEEILIDLYWQMDRVLIHSIKYTIIHSHLRKSAILLYEFISKSGKAKFNELALIIDRLIEWGKTEIASQTEANKLPALRNTILKQIISFNVEPSGNEQPICQLLEGDINKYDRLTMDNITTGLWQMLVQTIHQKPEDVNEKIQTINDIRQRCDRSPIIKEWFEGLV